MKLRIGLKVSKESVRKMVPMVLGTVAMGMSKGIIGKVFWSTIAYTWTEAYVEKHIDEWFKEEE
jgi:hypothetical protein